MTTQANKKELTAIATIITKACGTYVEKINGAQAELVARYHVAAVKAKEVGVMGFKVFSETLNAQKDTIDFTVANKTYVNGLIKHARLFAGIDITNIKTLSAAYKAVQEAEIAEARALDEQYKAKHVEQLRKEKELKDAINARQEEEIKARKVAEQKPDDELAKAELEQAESARKAREAELKTLEREKTQTTKSLEKVATTLKKVDAPKQVTATAPTSKKEELKPASAPSIPKAHVVDIAEMATELADCAAELATTWGTFNAGKPSQTIAAKIGTLINRMAATSAELAKATK